MSVPFHYDGDDPILTGCWSRPCRPPCRKVAAITGPTRVQLCGRFAVVLDGQPVHPALPGRRGRLLVAFLAVRHHEPVDRDELIGALWSGTPPQDAAAALTVLLSRVRAVLGADTVSGRGSLVLRLPPGALIDVETAVSAVHEAESAVALGQWHRAQPPAEAAMFVTRRRFLPEADAPWVEDWRNRLDVIHLRALTAYANCCLELGGTELAGAERSARRLIELQPYAETGHRLLMQSLAARGDVAAALMAYEELRRLLREELGVSPGPAVRDLHTRLLG